MKFNVRKHRKVDILGMPEIKRFRMLREIKEKLRTRIAEEKMLRFLMESEVLSINGRIVYRSDEPLQGISLEDMW